jgi:hypothetical protein
MKRSVTAFCLLAALASFALAEGSKTTELKLKPEAALELRNAQHEMDKTTFYLSQMLGVNCQTGPQTNEKFSDLLNRWATGQSRLAANKSAMDALISKVLKDSGFDSAKYALDPDTLAVTERPAPPAPVSAKK